MTRAEIADRSVCREIRRSKHVADRRELTHDFHDRLTHLSTAYGGDVAMLSGGGAGSITNDSSRGNWLNFVRSQTGLEKQVEGKAEKAVGDVKNAARK